MKISLPVSHQLFQSTLGTMLKYRINLALTRKVPKFSDARKLCCNLPKIQTKSPNLRVFSQEDADGIANSEDPDQTAPPGAV